MINSTGLCDQILPEQKHESEDSDSLTSGVGSKSKSCTDSLNSILKSNSPVESHSSVSIAEETSQF